MREIKREYSNGLENIITAKVDMVVYDILYIFICQSARLQILKGRLFYTCEDNFTIGLSTCT